MLGTLAVLIGLSSLFFSVLLSLLGGFSIFTFLILVVLFNMAQWLFSPYLIDAIYRTRKISESEEPGLHQALARISERSRIGIPQLRLAKLSIPNAFAYGSPIAGRRIAVTTGLLEELSPREVEAVIGHEVGHLKHRDVQIMMLSSLLPALFYFIGYSLVWSGRYGGSGRSRENGGIAVLVGLASILVYWLLSFLVLGLSRLREYYADVHSAGVVDEGSRHLSTGLAKIVAASNRKGHGGGHSTHAHAFKALFIADPDTSSRDMAMLAQMGVGLSRGDQALVDELLNRRVTFSDKLLELFSTHPNIVKRLRALRELEQQA